MSDEIIPQDPELTAAADAFLAECKGNGYGKIGEVEVFTANM